MTILRPYQQTLEELSFESWMEDEIQNILLVLATGGGKTVNIGSAIKRWDQPAVAIAHRQELVGQISTALAREGIRHAVLAPSNVVRSIISQHMEDVGRDFINPMSHVRVAGVDTLVKMNPANDRWFGNVRLKVMDEGHHVLRANKWGRASEMFPNAKGLFVSATPVRADGCGLGRHADGLVDRLIIGPPMRHLINMGYLTDYRVVCPEPSVDLSQVHISETTGDFNAFEVRRAVHQSPRLVGDVVREYLRWAPGKLGVTFAVDVESATEIAEAYRLAGVPAEVVTAKTPNDMRRSILRRFRNREILQLVNVDLFGEGFDLPAIEVVSMARPTQSYSLYAQQFGRALRLMISPIYAGAWDKYTDAQRLQIIAESGKPKALIIDHVGNIERHGLPDAPREWSLDRRERRAKGGSDAIPLRTCLNWMCSKRYERIHKKCPYCDTAPPAPESRSSLQAVDGDLTELDPAYLAAMRGEVIDVEAPAEISSNMSANIQRKQWKDHKERVAAQIALRHAIGTWAAVHAHETDSMNYRRFYFLFGVDVITAMSYKAKDAALLRERIEQKLAIDGYVIKPYTPPIPTEVAA